MILGVREYFYFSFGIILNSHLMRLLILISCFASCLFALLYSPNTHFIINYLIYLLIPSFPRLPLHSCCFHFIYFILATILLSKQLFF